MVVCPSLIPRRARSSRMPCPEYRLTASPLAGITGRVEGGQCVLSVPSDESGYDVGGVFGGLWIVIPLGPYALGAGTSTRSLRLSRRGIWAIVVPAFSSSHPMYRIVVR